jgi:DNA-binding NarL/FixJ family response regulator
MQANARRATPKGVARDQGLALHGARDASALQPLRILLLDDHPILRAGLRSLLCAQADFDVVAEADSAEVALPLVGKVRPDLILLDFSLPGMNGADAARRIKQDMPLARLLAVSAHDEFAIVRSLLEAGADGYLLKRSACEQLVPAVRQVAAGLGYLDPALPQQINQLGARRGSESGFEPEVLSDREAEVSRLLAQGLTMKEIAQQLSLSPRTLETYRARAMEKLGLKSRADLIRHAMKRGWLIAD